MHRFPKIHLQQGFTFNLVLKLFLIFHQTSGLCFYKIFLVKKECNSCECLPYATELNGLYIVVSFGTDQIYLRTLLLMNKTKI